MKIFTKNLKMWILRLLKLCFIAWCVARLKRTCSSQKLSKVYHSDSKTDHHEESNVRVVNWPASEGIKLPAILHRSGNSSFPLDKAFRFSVEVDGKTRRLPDRFMNDQLISRHNSDFIFSPRMRSCHSDIRLLVLIKSSLANFKQRRIIRKTWGSNENFDGYKVRFLFLLGQPRENETDFNEILRYEVSEYDDIVAGNYTDTYRNLTRKALMGLNYATKYCSNAEFLLSVDDDVFVDMRKTVLNYLTEFTRPATQKLQCGLQTMKNAKVARKGKWGVEQDIYDRNFYPPYCLGPCYLMTLDVAAALHRVSSHVPHDIPIDDVMVTGIMREKIGLYLTSMRKGLCEHLGNQQNVTGNLMQAWRKREQT